MKILKTDNEVNLELAKIKLQSPTALKIKGYGDLYYDCGCGESHNINDDEILKFAENNDGLGYRLSDDFGPGTCKESNKKF